MYVTLQLLDLIRKIATVVFIGLVYQSQRSLETEKWWGGRRYVSLACLLHSSKGETSGWCPLFAHKNERLLEKFGSSAIEDPSLHPPFLLAPLQNEPVFLPQEQVSLEVVLNKEP